MKLDYKKTFYVGLAFFLITLFWQTYDTIISKILIDKFLFGDSLKVLANGRRGNLMEFNRLKGNIDFEGKCELGHNAKVGYFAQNQASLLDNTLTVKH